MAQPSAFSFSEKYVVTNYLDMGYGEVGLYTNYIYATGPLGDVDPGRFYDATPVELTVGHFTFAAVLGDDPAFVPGRTSAALTNYDHGMSPPLRLNRLAVSWTPSNFTMTAIGFDLADDTNTILALDYENTAGSFGAALQGVARLGDAVVSRTVAAAGQTTVTSRTVDGSPAQVVIVTASGTTDTTPPTVRILTPTNNHRVFVPQVTITGRATDNVGVSNVQVWIGSGPGVPATMTSGTNWTAELTGLLPGTNLVHAVSTDFEGLNSTTAVLRVIYVLSAPLEVRMIGQGSVSPNYNGQWLEIQRAYSMTATASNKHRFSHWIQATNNLPGSLSSNATLNFTMVSNLTLTAVFVDTNLPTITVSNLAANQRITNTTYTVRGRATDNVGVTAVRWRLNGGPWNEAVGTTAWTATLALIPATNRFEVYSEDAVGNRSPVTAITFMSVIRAPLIVTVTGSGTLSPNYNGSTLDVGVNYSMTANPASGHLFDQWTLTAGGASVTNLNRTLTFAMQSNLVINARFASNPYPSLATTYIGLFFPPERTNITVQNSGFVSLKLTTTGTFTGYILFENASNYFTGNFSASGVAHTTIARGTNTPLSLDLQYHFSQTYVSGAITGADWTSAIGSMIPVMSGTSNPFAGTYNMFVEGFGAPPNTPAAEGPFTVTVTSNGSLTVAGRLADNTAVTQKTVVAWGGYWPFYAPLYGGRGLVLGWLSMDPFWSSWAHWVKPPTPGDPFYPSGFSTLRSVEVHDFFRQANGANSVRWTNGEIRLGAGNLSNEVVGYFVLSNNVARFWHAGVSNLTLQINPTNGSWSGSFRHPVTGSNTPFLGTLVQQYVPFNMTPDWGTGFFMGTNESGYVFFLGSSMVPPDAMPPVLTVISHTDGAAVQGLQVTLAGTATDAGQGDSGVSSVMVNGVRASNDSASGAGMAFWSVTITLNPGTNTLVIEARDANVNSNLVTRTLTLVAPGTPPAIVAPPVSLQRIAGQTASFTVIATGSPPLTYQWRLNNTNLVDGGRVSGATNATLTISNLLASDAGAYIVTVSNGVGLTNAPPAMLVVLPLAFSPAPSLVQGQMQLTILGAPGHRIEIRVSADLIRWDTLAVVTNVTGTYLFTEPVAGHTRRFYQAVELP